MNEQLKIKMKKGSQEPGASAPAPLSAFAVGGCWRLSAIVGDIFSQPKDSSSIHPSSTFRAPPQPNAHVRPMVVEFSM
jgi:hypothetical protein